MPTSGSRPAGRYGPTVDLGAGCGLRQGTAPGGGIVWRGSFNTDHWKHALVEVGVIPRPAKGETHAAAREHGMHALRHFYASVLLDAGESITVVSKYMGHTDPGLTLRVYAHLMPNSKERSRAAVAAVYDKFGP